MNLDDPTSPLLAAARSLVVPEELEWPWKLVIRSIELGWVDQTEDLLQLEVCDSIGFQEFLIEPNYEQPGEVVVSFLDESYTCDRALLIEYFRKLHQHLNPPTN